MDSVISKIEEVDIFPTKMFSYKVADKDLLFSLVEQVYNSKERMQKVSWSTQEQHIDRYITDFDNPTKLPSFERVVEEFNRELINMGLYYHCDLYWTSLYKRYSVHEMHDHRSIITSQNNYSGILYLSSIGKTNFFSNNPSSAYNIFSVDSDYGRVVLFPSTLPHQVITNFDANHERCVIAFNGRLVVNE